MNPEICHTYLERCMPPRSHSWMVYVQSRVPEVVAQITRLRRFAGLRPGRVRDLVSARASTLDSRPSVPLHKLEVNDE